MITLFFTGGIYFYVGPKYDYDYDFDKIEEGQGFIPRHFHLGYKVSEIPLIPVLLHVIYSRLPKTLNISIYDITYLKRHKGFASFKIDKLSIIFDNGEVADLITTEKPESERIFQITENWQDAIIIKNAVKDRSSFKYHIEGVSTTTTGKLYPFKYEVKYKYSYGFQDGTRFQKWASI